VYDKPLVPRIASRRHAVVQLVRAVASQRTADDPVLLDGEHLVSEALRARIPLTVVLVYGDRFQSLVNEARRANADIYDVTADVLDAVSPVRTPSGIVALARWTPAAVEDTIARAPGIVMGLVDVQDPGNAGTIIRSADALGGKAVLALDATADPAGWKCLRGAMGSTFRVPVARGAASDAILAAREADLPIIAAVASGGMPIDDIDLHRKALVLLGSEGAGLPQPLIDQADIRLTVPMRPGANSLNVATTAALVLWQARP
jgi:TrmH family RNA methyltransferase